MTTPPKGAFTSVTSARGQQGSFPFERIGQYIMRIDEVRYIETRSPKGFAVAVDKTVLAVKWKTPENEIPAGASPTDVHRGHSVGEKVTDFIDFRKDYAADAMKSLLMTCFAITDPYVVGEEHCQMACSAAQPMRGFIVQMDNTPKPNQAGTVVYCRSRYTRVVSASELVGLLDADGLRALGGEDVLAKMIEAEAAAAETES